MRTVSDHISGPSPIMIAAIVGSSIFAFGGIAVGIYSELPISLEWSTMTKDVKIFIGVGLFILALMTGLAWMILNLSITINGNHEFIRARIFPFMRAYRKIRLSEVERIRVIRYRWGRYGGVGYKKNFMGRTSYTLHLNGDALVIYLKDKKELHVEISKVEEWKRFVEAFENRTL